MPEPSYVHGASPVPLLGETIGERLRRTVERFGDREALVVRHQGYRATYRELWEQVDLAARGLLALARAFRQSDYAGMLAEVRDRCPALRRALVLEDDWDALLHEGARVSP